jgi:hypothetical protein
MIFFPWLFFFAVSRESPLHGHPPWRNLVTRKPRLPSFSKAVATVSLTSPLYKITQCRRAPLSHGLRRRYPSTGRLPSAAKDQMDQSLGRNDHFATDRQYRHLPYRCLLRPKQFRHPLARSFLLLLPLLPLRLPVAPQSSRVTWTLQISRKHNMSTLISIGRPRMARWLCFHREKYRSSSQRQCGSNVVTLACLRRIRHRPLAASTVAGSGGRGRNLPRGDSFALSMQHPRRLFTLMIWCPVGYHLPSH